jgi:type I restriction enzyme S subunit
MSGYPLVRLGQAVTLELHEVPVESAHEYPLAGVYSFGRGLFRRNPIVGSDTHYNSLFQVREGQLVVSRLKAFEGAVAVVRSSLDGLFVSQEFPTFTPTTNADSRYLGYLCQWPGFWELLQGASKGVGARRERVHPEQLLQLRVPLPDLEEQQRVATLIQSLLGSVEAATERAVKAKKYLRPLWQAVLDRALKGISAPFATLASVLEDSPRNGWSPRGGSASGGTAVLTLGAVTGFQYNGQAVKFTDQATDPAARYWLTEGDLLFTRSNTPELVGHAAIYDGTPSPCIFPDLMMRTRLAPQLADPRFTLYWLQLRGVREFIRGRAKGTSQSMVKISQRDVEEVPFPRLSLPEQRGIVHQLDILGGKVEAFITKSKVRNTLLEGLASSILNRAFAGEL